MLWNNEPLLHQTKTDSNHPVNPILRTLFEFQIENIYQMKKCGQLSFERFFYLVVNRNTEEVSF